METRGGRSHGNVHAADVVSAGSVRILSRMDAVFVATLVVNMQNIVYIMQREFKNPTDSQINTALELLRDLTKLITGFLGENAIIL